MGKNQVENFFSSYLGTDPDWLQNISTNHDQRLLQ
jgi:hypothetical protein